MKTELEKLSDSNLIALYNYLTLVGIRIGIAEESEYYEYGIRYADFSLIYPMYKESDLIYTMQETTATDIEYESKFNPEDVACCIEYDRLVSLTREKLIYIVNDEIVNLLDSTSPDKNRNINLYDAMSHIASLVNNDSLLNNVEYLA